MASVGVDLLHDSRELASIGPIEAIPKLRRYYTCLGDLVRAAKARRPQLVILIDFPDFNLRLAKRLKAMGLSIIYYISPQVWAWRKGRIRLIRKYVDKMLVILPFEKEFYRVHGVNVSYVGHPLVHTGPFTFDRASFCRTHKIAADRKLIALLPGSRVREVRYILPPLLDASALIAARVPATFLLAGVEGVPLDIYTDLVRRSRRVSAGVDVRLLVGRSREILSVSDVALIKSGTSTLEAILADVPFLMVYKISWLSWYIGKMLVATPHFGLVNLIAGRRVVPELLQGEASPERIAAYVLQWFNDPAEMARIRREFQTIKEILGTGDASQEAARIILEYMQGGAFQSAPTQAVES